MPDPQLVLPEEPMSDIVEVTESGGVTTTTLTRECVACRGTGLYAGEGERDGAAVVCHNCKGEGQEVVSVSGVAFTGRKPCDVKRVYLYNPGICVGEMEHLHFRTSVGSRTLNGLACRARLSFHRTRRCEHSPVPSCGPANLEMLRSAAGATMSCR